MSQRWGGMKKASRTIPGTEAEDKRLDQLEMFKDS
jgi:hypothetical protein